MKKSVALPEQPLGDDGTACGDPEDYCSNGENPGNLPRSFSPQTKQTGRPKESDYAEYGRQVLNIMS